MAPEQLISAIRAALDATERIAKLAQNYGPGEWTYRDGDYGPHVLTDGESPMSTWDRDVNDGVWNCDDPDDGCWELRANWRAEGEHIAHNDPAAVLRRVAADREIVDAHDREHYCPLPVVVGIHGQLWTVDEGPCYTLRALARGFGINPEETE